MSDAGSDRSRGLTIWHGMGLPRWLQLLAMRPPIDGNQLPRVALLSVTSVLNSLLNAAESVVWSRRVRRVELHAAPIFILGHWRSGTTLLHSVLAMDRQFGWINTYEAMFPGHFLLTESLLPQRLAWMLPERRPTDRMRVGWDLPQEDEFALLVLTLLSPYLQAVLPNQPAKWRRLASMQSGLTSHERDVWEKAFLTLLKKTTLRHGGRRLVLKSPPHTARIPTLLKLFPQALFVHLVRNPYDVFSSTLRLRQSMAQINGFSRRIEPPQEDAVLQDYMAMYQAYQMHKALIPRGRLVEMRYEDLVEDPIAATSAIYDQLGLSGFDEVRPQLDRWLVEHRQYQARSERPSEEQRRRIAAAWGPAFRRYGYPL